MVYRDPNPPTPTQPEYNKNDVDPRVLNYTEQTREKKYGEHTREVMARAAEIISIVANEAKVSSEEAIEITQSLLDGSFDDAELAANFEEKLRQKEQEYAPELTSIKTEVDTARGTSNSLADRLNSTDEQLAEASTDLTERAINAKFHGAAGDGVTDDWAALQSAIELAETMNNPLFIPKGVYYISKTLRTRHQISYHYRPGIKIYGVGKETVIKGDDLRVGADYTDPSKLSEQALLAVHSSNNIIKDIMFQGGKVGLYLGQDPSTTELSHASLNVIENIWFYYNGTSYIMQSGGGCYYNKTKNIHIAHSQIGVHLAPSLSIAEANNNRNYFDGVRVTRSWIGYFAEEADGNTFNGCFSESITSETGLGDAPPQLPSELSGKACSIITGSIGSNNKFVGFSNEDCDWDICSKGYNNDFLGATLKDGSSSDLKVMFPVPNRPPRTFLGNYTKVGNIEYQPNPNMFWDGAAGSAVTGRIYDKGYDNQNIDLKLLCSQILSSHSYSKSTFFRLGRVCDWTISYRFQPISTLSSTEPIKIKIPFSEKMKLNVLYTTGLTGTATFPFKAFVSSGGEEALARFSTPTEAESYGGEHLIISPPTTGWDPSLIFLYVKLRYEVSDILN